MEVDCKLAASNKILKFGTDARDRMMEGIEELEKAVITTLGPVGRNCLFDRGTSHPIITKDGVSVAREIKFSDHYKNVGASIIKEAAENVNTIAGDGTTTTVLLASELCKEGVNLVAAGKEPVELQKGMDAAANDIVSRIDNYKLQLRDDKDILSIATISANNDEAVGKVVYDAFTGIGEGGKVNLQDSHTKSGKTTVEFSDGMEFEKGLTDGRFTTDKRKETLEIDEPNVVLLDYSPSLQDMSDLLNWCVGKSQSCIMIANEFDESLESMCVNMDVQRGMKFACINAPGMSQYEISEELKDLASVLGTTVIKNNDDLKDFTSKVKDGKNPFGSCKHLSSKVSFKTTITEGKGTEEQIDARVKEIEADIEKGKNDPDLGLSEDEISVMRTRIARLTGGIATIMVGGLSVTRIKELKDRYEDAIHAVEAAISDGIVPGGGVTLLKCARDLEKQKKKFANDSFQAGYEAVIKVCKIPAMKIIKSVTSDYAFIISKIEHNRSKAYGFNAKKVQIEDDMFAAGIIDPVKVEKAALSYAASVAGIFITTECVITDEASNISLVPNDEMTERIDPNYGGLGIGL